MGADQTINWRRATASALDWWHEAGVDTLVDDTPRAWLREPLAVEPRSATIAAAPPPAAPLTLPDTIEAFEAWRVGPDAPEAGWPGRPIAASGDPAATLAILVDMPERDDGETLLDGPAGALFDRMLAAIGRDRSNIYLAPLCAIRPISGQILDDHAPRLAELARHRLALCRPQRLLLMGNAASRALLGVNGAAGRGRLHILNHGNGQTEAVASFPPRFLLEQPARKAEAWKDLQLVIGDLA
ncbi:uracil-DNA glycosylase family protein [Hephaestia sp. GCM10023244]|uniref:uracil-DNA glycosylase family protein n=1 Tax=unclassified Hephaestia TaxID=2631281 RepID=UPI0020770A30|nr:uracil-DNA glycosylase family protein [Hephaestia sp. MAHUQ-44]MCM8731345.1 uracil-DNA glycosylase [Hephaestia sp. MAHUQ-44]